MRLISYLLTGYLQLLLTDIGSYAESLARAVTNQEVYHRIVIQDEVGQSSEHSVEIPEVVQGRGDEPEQNRREQESPDQAGAE
jgi:hypothetical protein